MKEFIQRWIITTVAVLVACKMVPGISYDAWSDLILATFVLGLLNAFLRPVLMILSLPLLFLTLGLFTFIINAALLLLVGELMKGFHVQNFKSALLAALVISLISGMLNFITGTNRAKVKVTRMSSETQAPPRSGRSNNDKDDGNGPIIDV